MAKKHKQTENKADKDTESQFSVSEACEDNLGTNENTEKEKIAVFTTVLGGSDASLRAVGLTGIKNSIVVFVSRSRQRFSRRRNNNASSKNIGAKDPKNKRKDNKPKKENSFFAKISKMLKKYSYFVFILIIIILLIWVFIHKNASQVYVDDKLVGTIKEKEITAEKIYNDALAKIQSEKGVNVKLNEEISLKPVHASKKEVVSADYILTEVCKNLTYQVEACSLVIDGKPIALIENEDTANKILDDFAKKYIAKDSQLVERSFVQNVKFEKKFVKNSEIETEDTILNKLSQSIDTPQQHIVGSGDSLFQIAVNADMSMDELIAANPGLNENSVLQPGQIINVVVPVPLLSVKTVEQIKYEENFDADVIVVDNNDEYKTYEKVITEGKQGKREVTINTTRLNGNEEEKNIVEEKVIEEPIAKKVERGTLQTPPKRALGSFIYPVSGRISSEFGERWGESHKGIDLACAKGTPIYASDGGTVEFSGWNDGGYGNLIIINHANGYKTYYAHNSENVVSAGELVYQGQLIGYVGSTGDSTGNHTHFEIRKNGIPEDPFNYL